MRKRTPGGGEVRFDVGLIRRASVASGKCTGPLSDAARPPYPIYDGKPETMVVCAATRKQGDPGDAGYIPEKGRRDGQTLREQFARAREIGTRFAMVVSWNEWTTGEQPSVEVSKDIEPSVEHGDKYLKILKEEIRRFKSE